MKIVHHLFVFLIITLIMIGGECPSTECNPIQLKVAKKVNEFPPDSISNIGGFIGSRLEANRKGYLHTFDIDHFVRMVENKKHREWKWVGEHPGKWLESAALAAETFDDQILLDKAQSILERLIAAQESSGYLGVTDPAVRTKEMPLRGMDAYELYFMLHGLLTAHELWNREDALQTACRLGDYFTETIGPGKAEFWPGPKGETIAGHHVHYSLEGTLLIDPMLRLYMTTGNEKYLEWSQWVVDNIDRWSGYDTFSNLDRVARGEIGVHQIQRYVHSHTLHMNLIGFLRLYQITGDHSLLRKVFGAWHDISHRQMYITGGVSFDEHYEPDHHLPIDGREVETCAMMSWIELSHYLYELTGDPVYADAIERLLWNHLFAAQTVDGEMFRYHTPLNGTKPANYFHGPDCCTASGPRITSKIPQLIYSVGENEIFINQFVPSTAHVKLDSGSSVKITQETTYPSNEKIVIQVEPQTSEPFSIHIRLPAWCKKPTLKINDKVMEKLRPGNYVTIDLNWKKGDRITLSLPMEPKWIERIHAEDKRWALTRGPLVYAVDTVLGESPLIQRGNGIPDNLSKIISWTLDDDGIFGNLEEIDLPNNSLKPGYRVHVALSNGKRMEINAWPFANSGLWYADPEQKPDRNEKRYAYAVWLPRDHDPISQRPLPTKPIPAFPGAEGAGAITAGGRGGKVLAVTNLNDSGPGSLRTALEAEEPRIVIFRISGIIDLQSKLTISHPFVTVAGQTAPGDGICIRGQTTEINTHDVVIRYLRFRRGNLKDRNDALGGYPSGNVIIDHCSFSWGLDENVSMYRYMKAMKDGSQQKSPTENITIQWCISSEALDLNNHAFGGTWGGRKGSFHHNLFACNTGRNPSIGWGEYLDICNNVLFNWRHRTIDGGDASSNINVIANYFKPGPAVNPGTARHRICRPQHLDMFSESDKRGKWYVEENFVEGYPDITKDNWKGGVQLDWEGEPSEEELTLWVSRVRASSANPAVPINRQTAEKAYELVLRHAGATVPKRDAADDRIIDMVRTGKLAFGNGIIDMPSDVGGWPTYESKPAKKDSDKDGMPDEWEKLYGLNMADPSDNSADVDHDGYTNIEEWINNTDPTQFVDYSKSENNRNTLTDNEHNG